MGICCVVARLVRAHLTPLPLLVGRLSEERGRAGARGKGGREATRQKGTAQASTDHGTDPALPRITEKASYLSSA